MGMLGPLDNQLGSQAFNIVHMDDVRAGSRDPDVTVDIDQCIAAQFLAVRGIGDTFPLVFEGNQSGYLKSCGVVKRSSGIGNTNENGPLFSEKARRVFTDGTEHPG